MRGHAKHRELAGPTVLGSETVSPVLPAGYWDRGYPVPAYALLGGLYGHPGYTLACPVLMAGAPAMSATSAGSS